MTVVGANAISINGMPSLPRSYFRTPLSRPIFFAASPLRVREFEGVCSDAVISLDFITQEVKISGKETEILPVDKKEPLSLEIQSFLGALEGKNELVVTPKQAVNVTKIAQASLLSSQKGTPIYLD